MHAIIDDQRRQPQILRARGQRGRAQLECGVGKAALGIDAQDRAGGVVQHRFGLGRDLACLDRAQAAFDPIDAVRLAMIALARDDDAAQRVGVLPRQPSALKDLGDEGQQFPGCQSRVGHGAFLSRAG